MVTDCLQSSIKRMSTCVGGLVDGLRLTQVAEEYAEQLKDALWRYGVLVFKNQNLQPSEHISVARALGRPMLHEHAPRLEGYPEIVRFRATRGRAPTSNRYHHDVTYREIPIVATVMQAIEVPPLGGDTIIASATMAYELMPTALKKMFLELEAIHDFAYETLRNEQVASYADPALMKNAVETLRPVVHPAIINHPYTGKCLLYVNEMWTKKIKGLPNGLSEQIIRIAVDLMARPEIQVRIHWEKGDVAIWDNFGVMHYGPVFDLETGSRRELHRIHVQADIERPRLDKQKALRQIDASQGCQE